MTLFAYRLLSDNFVLFINGVPELIGGTSAAAPLFAAILNRINEERLAAGKKTVGFVNPTLYSNPQVLHDITSGSNPGCNTNGFSAVSGWVSYSKLLCLILRADMTDKTCRILSLVLVPLIIRLCWSST